MTWKRLTFILIPHSQSTVKQVSVHRTLIYGALFFLGVGIAIMVFYIIGFKGKSFYAARVEKITEENRILEHQLAVFDTSLTRIQSKLVELDSLNLAILKESNISARDLQAEKEPGLTERKVSYRFPIERTLYLIDRLEMKSRAFESDFSALHRTAMKGATMKDRAYYHLKVMGTNETLRACRRLARKKPNIYIEHIYRYDDSYSDLTGLPAPLYIWGLIEIMLVSPEPGPALPYYGQLKGRLPEVHKPYVKRYLSKHGALSLHGNVETQVIQ